MQRIHALDQELTRLFDAFSAVARSLQLQQLGDLDDQVSTKVSGGGIYLIELQTSQSTASFDEWRQQFLADFDRQEHRKCWIPTVKAKRIGKHIEVKPWMPIYIGKSKKLSNRLHEHINLQLDKPTTALKLKARELWETKRYRVQILPLAVQNYDLIAPRMESALREHINPILGRQ